MAGLTGRLMTHERRHGGIDFMQTAAKQKVIHAEILTVG
jgi:hypothetical protein